MRIGVFDSGLGGITLLNQALRLMPDEEYLYYADVDHVPYGEKTPEQILSYVDESMRFMTEHGCKAVVIGCNTATSVGVSHLRDEYKDIPIIGIEPAVKPAVTKFAGDGRVLIAATKVTIEGEKLKKLIARFDKHGQVDKVALPGLVRFAENGEFVSDAVTEYLKSALKDFDFSKYSVLVLGCTHFNFFKDTFATLMPGARLIDGSKATIINLQNKLKDAGKLEVRSGEEPQVLFYNSGRLVTDAAELEKITRLQERWMELN